MEFHKYCCGNSNCSTKMSVRFHVLSLILLVLVQGVLVQTKPFVEYTAKHHRHHKNEDNSSPSAATDDNLVSARM